MDDEKCNCETDEFVAKIRAGMLDDDTIIEIADLFKVFADSTRVRIMWALHESEMCVRGISKSLGITMSAASHQLKTLKDADLVASRREGKQVFYSLCDEHIEMLLSTALTHLKEEK
jgi:ArsR family transcriptional regulator